MAFMRRRRRVRSAFRRKRRAPTNRTLNKKIKSIQSKQEVKQHFVTHATANVVLNTADIDCINLIAVGDTNENREGDFATLTSVQWRGRIRPSTSNVVHQAVRHIVFWDFQSNATLLTSLAQLLDDPNSPYSAYLTQGVTPRFKVIHDKIYDLHFQTGTTGTVGVIQTSQKVINKKKVSFNRKVTWNTAIDATLPYSGALYSAFITDAATNGADCEVRFKVGFKDD